MNRIKNPIKLLLYIILYLLYSFGLFFYSVCQYSRIPDFMGIEGLAPGVIQLIFRPILGQIIALLLLLLPPDSFYKKNILSNSNKILLGSFIVDCIISFILLINNVRAGDSIEITAYLFLCILLFTGAYLPFYITYLLWKIKELIMNHILISNKINNILEYCRYAMLFILYDIFLFCFQSILPQETSTIIALLYHLALGLIFAILLPDYKSDNFYKREIYSKSNYIMIGLIILDCVVCLALGITAIQDVVENSLLFLFTGAYLPFYLVYLGHNLLQYLRERKN